MRRSKDIVLITGAGSGMGKLAAERAARKGQHVVAFDLNEESLKDLEYRYDNVTTFVIDITHYQLVEETVTQIVTTLGTISRVINCAGIMPLGTLRSQHATEIKQIMDVNYIGTVNINKAVLPHMLDAKHGEIVNFASIAGWSPTISFGAYNAAKFAVVAFSEVLHYESRRNGIKVCCVCPPPVNTPLFRNAINRPKSLDIAPAIEPEFVLDALEKSLTKGKWLCLPGWQTKVAYIARRFAPNLLWTVINIAEGQDLDHLSRPSTRAKSSPESPRAPVRRINSAKENS